MNTKEAIQAMLDGKKVRKITWGKNIYIFFDGYILKDNLNINFETLYMKFSDDWEIYEELKPVQTVTIEKWLFKDEDEYFVLEGNENYLLNANKNMEKVKLLETYEVTL